MFTDEARRGSWQRKSTNTLWEQTPVNYARRSLSKAAQRLTYTVRTVRMKAQQGLWHGGTYIYEELKTRMAERPWPFWAGACALLLIGIGLVWGIDMGLLSVLPALAFVVALILLGVKIAYPSGDSLRYRVFDGLHWVAVSYIPAYFMFMLVSDIPRNQDLKNIRPFLANQTAMLAGDGEAVVAELKRAARYEGANPPTRQDFVAISETRQMVGS